MRAPCSHAHARTAEKASSRTQRNERKQKPASRWLKTRKTTRKRGRAQGRKGIVPRPVLVVPPVRRVRKRDLGAEFGLVVVHLSSTKRSQRVSVSLLTAEERTGTAAAGHCLQQARHTRSIQAAASHVSANRQGMEEGQRRARGWRGRAYPFLLLGLVELVVGDHEAVHSRRHQRRTVLLSDVSKPQG